MGKKFSIYLICIVFMVIGLSACTGEPTATPSLLAETTSTQEMEPTPTLIEVAQPTLTRTATATLPRLPTFTATPPLMPVRSLTPIVYTEMPGLTSPITGTLAAATTSPGALGVYTFISQARYAFWPLDGQAISWKTAAFYLEFSHYANRMVTWEQGQRGKLVLSDLALKQQQVLLSDAQGVYPLQPAIETGRAIKLFWSPDDMHAFLEVEGEPALNRIYHVQTGLLENWPYRCDRLATSPLSQRLVVWCEPLAGERKYAVMEWGGDIWYSQSASTQAFLQSGADGVQPWAWSADGEQLAYFDPNDATGSLYLTDAYGNLHLKTLEGGAYRPVPQPDQPSQNISQPAQPLQWSQNGTRLVVFAYGSEERPCPAHQDETGAAVKAPCWQVINVTTGEVIWTVADTLGTFVTKELLAMTLPSDFTHPAISPLGSYLAICYAPAGAPGRVALINLDNKVVTPLFDGSVTTLRWGNGP